MGARRIQFHFPLLCCAIAAAIGSGAPYAWAQTSGAGGQATATAPKDETLTEIVVTAERRTETVQSATQSITAISGAQLQAQGLTTVQDVLAEVPGVSIGQDGAGQSEVFLRGMAAQGGIAPTTGFYLDGVSLPGPAASTYGHATFDPNLYDVSDVNVLRGPQGTLYGASSMGGTININTNQPNLNKFGASVEAIGSGTQGGGANGGVSAMVNIPLVDDKLALRIVGTDSYTSGWIDRINLGPINMPATINGAGGLASSPVGVTPVSQDKGSNWQTIEGARVILLWAPTDNFSVAPEVVFQRLAQGGASLVDLNSTATAPLAEAHYQPFNIAEPYSDTLILFNLPIKYTINDIQLVSITGYAKRNSKQIQDSSAVGVAVFDPPTTTYADVGPVGAYEADYTSVFTQEFRASSTGDGAFQWLGGAYYENYKSQTYLASTTPANAYVDAQLGSPPGVDWFNFNYVTKLTQYSAFGEASYKFGDLKLTGGLRYYYYDVPTSLTDWGAFQTGNWTAATALFTPTTASASGYTPRINLSYIPNSNLTLYAQASEGFRPGFGNAQPAPAQGCPSSVPAAEPDHVWNYEAGEKARLMDGNLSLNGAIYYENWSGIQQTINLICSHGDYAYSGNAGNAAIYGAELEATLRLTPEVTFTNSVGLVDAKFTAASPQSGFFVGEALPLVSKWTDTASLVYTHHLNDNYNVVFRATDTLRSTQTFVGIVSPKENFLSLRVGLASHNKVSAWLFADNALNSHTYLGLSNAIFTELFQATRGVSPQPRTIGLQLDYAFGGP
jgi:outer membrane receptor protein involved in Fe transport